MKKLLSFLMLSVLVMNGTTLYAQTYDIAGVKYSNIRDAVNAVPASGVKTTITVIANNENETQYATVKNGQNIELRLQSYTLKLTSHDYQLFEIEEGATLSIISDNGTIEKTYAYNKNLFTNYGTLLIDGVKLEGGISNYGTLNIKNVSIENTLSSAVWNTGTATVENLNAESLAEGTYSYAINNSGTFTIKSGYITGIGSATVNNSKNGILNVYGGTIEYKGTQFGHVLSNNGTLNLYGGTLISEKVDAVSNESDGTINMDGGIIESSYRAVYNNGTLNVVDGLIQSHGSTSAALSNGGTVVVSGGTIKNDAKGTAFGNGSDGTATIAGGTIVNTGTGDALSNYGILEFTGGVIENYAESGYSAVYNYASGKMNATGGIIKNNTTGSTLGNIGTLTVDGATIQGAHFRQTLSCANNGILYVKSGTIINTSTGAAVCNYGKTMQISGGTLQGNVCAIAVGKTATISGATITNGTISTVIPNDKTLTLAGRYTNADQSLTRVGPADNNNVAVSLSDVENVALIEWVSGTDGTIQSREYPFIWDMSSDQNLKPVIGTKVSGVWYKLLTDPASSSASGVAQVVSVPTGEDAYSNGVTIQKSIQYVNGTSKANYNVTGIVAEAFRGCTNLVSIKCEATTPIALGENAFDDISPYARIYVPSTTSAQTYKAASGWSKYANIIYSITDRPIISCNSSLNMGSHDISEVAESTFEIKNTGKIALDITNIVFLAEGYSIAEELPVTIPAGGKKTITVQYSGNVAGNYATEMQIYSNDPENGAKSVNVSGTLLESNFPLADVNKDGQIDVFDVVAALSVINGDTSMFSNEDADVNGDSQNDIFDVVSILEEINKQNNK